MPLLNKEICLGAILNMVYSLCFCASEALVFLCLAYHPSRNGLLLGHTQMGAASCCYLSLLWWMLLLFLFLNNSPWCDFYKKLGPACEHNWRPKTRPSRLCLEDVSEVIIFSHFRSFNFRQVPCIQTQSWKWNTSGCPEMTADSCLLWIQNYNEEQKFCILLIEYTDFPFLWKPLPGFPCAINGAPPFDLVESILTMCLW